MGLLQDHLGGAPQLRRPMMIKPRLLTPDTADAADHSAQQAGEQTKQIVEKSDDVRCGPEKRHYFTSERAERAGGIARDIQRDRAQIHHETQEIDRVAADVEVKDLA